jgi:hypothetical protein
MSPALLAGLVVATVLLGAGIAVFVAIRQTLAANAQVGTITVNTMGLAFHVRCWVGTDSVELSNAFRSACLSLLPVWSPEAQHEVLDGVFVVVTKVDAWQEPWSGREVAGIATPGTRTVAVDKGLRALAHEFAHLLEAKTPVGDPNREHAGWVDRGIQKAIEAYEATR